MGLTPRAGAKGGARTGPAETEIPDTLRARISRADSFPFLPTEEDATAFFAHVTSRRHHKQCDRSQERLELLKSYMLYHNWTSAPYGMLSARHLCHSGLGIISHRQAHHRALPRLS